MLRTISCSELKRDYDYASSTHRTLGVKCCQFGSSRDFAASHLFPNKRNVGEVDHLASTSYIFIPKANLLLTHAANLDHVACLGSCTTGYGNNPEKVIRCP